MNLLNWVFIYLLRRTQLRSYRSAAIRHTRMSLIYGLHKRGKIGERRLETCGDKFIPHQQRSVEK